MIRLVTPATARPGLRPTSAGTVIALVRAVSPAMARCELTHVARTPIDVAQAREQHAAYVATLSALGCRIVEVDAAPALPDSVFVEDTAVVLDELAIITRPGAVSRRPEGAAVEHALTGWRTVARIEAPGTLDGGDVLRIGRTVYVGTTARSNAQGISQLERIVARFGYRVVAVPVRGCLHLKSAVTCVAPDALLLNAEWIDAGHWRGMRILAVARGEPHAANALRVGDVVVHAASAPRTRERLEAAGLRVRPVDVSEMEKAEGAVTCCSIVFAP
jgi:dimethylargininase